MDWRLHIIKADNGYILEAPRVESTDENGNDIVTIDREVIEEDYNTSDSDRYETDDQEKIAMARMLEKIAEYFGMHHDKYAKDNINIKFNYPGSKVYDEGEEEKN